MKNTLIAAACIAGLFACNAYAADSTDSKTTDAKKDAKTIAASSTTKPAADNTKDAKVVNKKTETAVTKTTTAPETKKSEVKMVKKEGATKTVANDKKSSEASTAKN